MSRGDAEIRRRASRRGAREPDMLSPVATWELHMGNRSAAARE